jgi:mRNA-degrading endonuclease RelE of RelBE toxin-antitoxin system
MEESVEIELHREAKKFYSSLNSKNKKIVDKALEDISLNKNINHNIRMLAGENGLYRYKAGMYRIVFKKTNEKLFSILRISTRENSYKN